MNIAPPGWLKIRAVISYRGGTEKILAVRDRWIDTVSPTGFIVRCAEGFYQAIANGEIELHSDRQQIRAISQQPTQLPYLKEFKAAQAFAELCEALGSQDRPHQEVLLWMRAITEGRPTSPRQHIIGLALLHLGADMVQLGPRVAAPSGRGRPSTRKEEAVQTQLLIQKFERFLEGDEDQDPLTTLDWGWLRSLVERGMLCAGWMPEPVPVTAGRPAEASSPARSILYQTATTYGPYPRGWRAETIQSSAVDTVLQRRQVAAAWLDEDHTTIVVAHNDEDVLVEFAKIETSFYKIQRRHRYLFLT